MPLLALVLSVFSLGFEQLVQWRYGAMGVIGLVLLTIGFKARNSTCIGIGAVVLVLLFSQPTT
ncbi:hypothetical protein GCM10020367_29860 [Streptomyces sannanensis]|uniref:Uncharacterized protein n=1 Tax=Streptomyces sannanensis TaxID=285536 RepID=A0ABP6SBM6_9ACTN